MKLGLLTVSLALALMLVSPSFCSAGLGLSVYDPTVTLSKGQVQEIPVGRIYNTGSETLIVNYAWKTKNSSLSVTFKHNNETLVPDENREVSVTVTTFVVGNFSGIIEIVTRMSKPVSGNPVCPAGSLKLSVVVVDVDNSTLPNNSTMLEPDNSTVSASGISPSEALAILSGVSGFVFLICAMAARYRKHEPEDGVET